MRTYGADSGVSLAAGRRRPEPRRETDSPGPVCLKQLLVAMTLAAEGDWAGAVAALDSRWRVGDGTSPTSTCSGTWATPRCSSGDDAGPAALLRACACPVPGTPVRHAVVYALQRLCFGYLVAGDWAAVRASADEALTLRPRAWASRR